MPNPLFDHYRAAPDSFDEMLDASGVPRAHWQAMLANLAQEAQRAPETIRQRHEMVQRQVRENGVTDRKSVV